MHLLLIRRILVVAAIVLAGTLVAHERTARAETFATSTGETMRWGALPIGAGGFVTGIAVHPRSADVVYARTDVGGLYAWQAASRRWQPLFTEAQRPAGAPLNVASLGMDPRNPATLYLALGATAADNGTFVKSTDSGRSWRVLSGPPVPVAGNEDFRWAGERLSVDPNNSSVVYFGSPTRGLWVSVTGGESWSQVSTSAVPVGTKHAWMGPAGVTFVLFDPRASLTNGRTSVIYAGVSRRGIYRTGDGGRSWQRILADDSIPQQAEIDANGTLYVTFFGNGSGSAGKVAKFAGGRWHTISPARGTDFSAITVDRTRPGRLWVSTYPLRPDGIYYSTDAGQSWRQLRSSMAETPAWWPSWSLWTLAGGLAHDPRHPDGLWLSTGLGIIHTSEGAAAHPRWRTRVDGIEVTVTFAAVSTRGGALVTGIADFDGFRHERIDAFPAVTHGRGEFITTTGIAVMGSNPNVLVSVGASHHEPWRRRAGYSTDNGRSWTDFPSIRQNNHPDALGFGNVAISATDAQNVVWQPSDWQPPYVTTDGGRTWRRLTAFERSPFNGGAHTHLWNRQRALAADTVRGGVFYLYHHVPGYLMRSTDGGREWSIASRDLPAGRWNTADLQAVPGRAGHLWIGLGDALYRSADSGSSFTRDPAVSRVSVLGFGAAAPGHTWPAAYLQGVVDGKEGIFRSIDGGGSWLQIGNFRATGNEPMVIAGDMNLFGRVYLGTSGSGFLQGALTTPPAPAIAPAPAPEPVISGTEPVSGPMNPEPAAGDEAPTVVSPINALRARLHALGFRRLP